MQIERSAFDARQHGSNFMGGCVVDVADEAQCQMVISRIDPARARQPTAQGRKRLADIGRNFDSGKKTRHAKLSNHDARPARARFVSSPTAAKMRATITQNPANFGSQRDHLITLVSEARTAKT